MAQIVKFGSISPSELRVLHAIARSQEAFAPGNPTYREIGDEAGINVSWIFRAVARLERGGFVKLPKKAEAKVKAPYRGRIVITKRGLKELEALKRKSA